MKPPSAVKEVQRIAGQIASRGRFVQKSADRYAEFFKILRNPHEFKWTKECQKTFEYLKNFLANPLLLATSVTGEDLYLYLAVIGKFYIQCLPELKRGNTDLFIM